MAKKQEDPPPGAPVWMTTYGDMVTLMLCFFVLLFSMSSTDIIRFREVLESFQGAYGPLGVDSESPMGQGPADSEEGNEDLKKKEQSMMASLIELVKTNEKMSSDDQEEMSMAQMQALRDEIEKILNSSSEYDGMSGIEEPSMVVIEERGILIRFQDRTLFDLGKADIRSEAVPLLNKVASILSELGNQIRIEGHTDDIPIGWSLRGKYPTNWELSAARATMVLRHLINAGDISPERMSASGYGEYRRLERLEDESLESYRQRLRRVDIVLLRTSSGEPALAED